MTLRLNTPYVLEEEEDFKKRSPLRLLLRIALVVVLSGLVIGGSLFGYYYMKFGKIVEQRLASPIFSNTAQIYAAPREVRVGQKLTATTLGAELDQAGYNLNPKLGSYELGRQGTGQLIKIKPGPDSYHSQDGAAILTRDGIVQQITADNGSSLQGYELEPLLITNLSDQARVKRRTLTYDDIPVMLRNAVMAIEDRRYFQHSGVDFIRLLGAVRNDLLQRHAYMEGGSTITMQVARGFFLSPEKNWRRKTNEMFIAMNLEHRLSKQQIFEMYANQTVNLGQQGSFAIQGFDEAARVYFGKDIRQIDLAQCALLAGMVQSPNRLNPYRHLERATARRNVVLDSMATMGTITKAQAAQAKAEPIQLAPPTVEASQAPYFVDLVHEQLEQKFGAQDLNNQGLRIYTSLDPQLQKAAAEAVDEGMASIDTLVKKLYGANANSPQVALVALNPHTGQVLALIGGRNYGLSQLNRAVAKRPTGSIFKPFVFAAAFSDSVNGKMLNGQTQPFTAVTTLKDEPTTFSYDNGRQTYTPHNYKEEYHGDVTAMFALAHSLNNATISLAEMVGYDAVADLGHKAGVTSAKATPAVAIGAYDATPLDMAGAYTVFANNGVHINPWLLASVRESNGEVLADYSTQSQPVLDPRAAFLSTSLMEGVMDIGYGQEVRRRGFREPAAGKTGTSHDAWFAGFTSNLICVVWVGNDDYTDVKLAGAQAAAPIWAAFMKRAAKLPQYSDMNPFTPPDGVVEIQLDKTTNLQADSACPDDYKAGFIAGTQPMETCSHVPVPLSSADILSSPSITPPPIITPAPVSSPAPSQPTAPSPPSPPAAAPPVAVTPAPSPQSQD